MKTKTLLLVLLSVVFKTTFAQEFSVGPTDDAHFFFHTSKTENYGSEPLLRSRFNTSGEFRTDIALKFDISGCTLTPPYDKVWLKLYGTDDGVVCPVRVLKFEQTYANSNWTESTINGTNRPGTNYATDSISQLNFEGDFEEKYHQWDITEWVSLEKAAGRNIINLHVRQMSVTGATFNDPIFFHSKENVSGKKPLIVITKIQSGVKSEDSASDWAYVSNGNLIIRDSKISNQKIDIYNALGKHIRTISADDTKKYIGDLKGVLIIKRDTQVLKAVL